MSERSIVTRPLDDSRARLTMAVPATRTYTVVAFAASFLILALRYPTALFAAEPLWEDGPIFLLGGFEGVTSLARPYQGYLHLAARMVAIVAAAIPPGLAPL